MGYSLGISTSESQNPGSNQSTVYVTGTLYTGGNSYAGYSTSYSVVIAGITVASGGGPSELWNPNSWSFSGSYTFTHDANGYRGAVGTAVYFSGSGGYSPGNLGTGGTTYGAIDYDRKPATPSAPTAVVNSNKTITVNWSAVSSPAGTATYYLQYAASVGGGGYGSWSTAVSTTSTTYTYSGLGRGATYKFRLYATNSDGTSATSSESSGYFLPAGGKIYDAGAFRLTAFGRKLAADGTTWTDLTTAKKYDGSNWIDLS